MTYEEALKLLNIQDYHTRIFNSNSRGELFHLVDYINMAEACNGNYDWFRPAFVCCVEAAERTWKRPESVFQHMPDMIAGLLDYVTKQDLVPSQS